LKAVDPPDVAQVDEALAAGFFFRQSLVSCAENMTATEKARHQINPDARSA